MKTKEVSIQFEYSNPMTLKEQIEYIYTCLLNGEYNLESFRYLNGKKTKIKVYQRYKKMRSFRLVTDKAIFIKSNV